MLFCAKMGKWPRATCWWREKAAAKKPVHTDACWPSHVDYSHTLSHTTPWLRLNSLTLNPPFPPCLRSPQSIPHDGSHCPWHVSCLSTESCLSGMSKLPPRLSDSAHLVSALDRHVSSLQCSLSGDTINIWLGLLFAMGLALLYTLGV